MASKPRPQVIFSTIEYLIRLLKEGRAVALVSDAGTPGILDPGYHIINLAIKNNIEITAIPGPTAFVNALILSGKPTHEFYFAGFLPNRKLARRNKLAALSKLKVTVVFYESPHRILACLEDVQAVFGERNIVVAREVTKKFEEIKRGLPLEIAKDLSQQRPRGEFVVII
ncbi:MAG: rRNA small subunit methyltransferase 1 [Candidatus Omnitrophica bacterium]|nr:rRNA small subunit methyltransferase 1 [Candidatus Omnitrophota bacterium]